MPDDWESEARKEQQVYYSLLGDRVWDAIDAGESTILMRKVGYGLFGPPGELPSDDNEQTGYSGEKLEFIKEITQKIRGPFHFDDEGIDFACIHLIALRGTDIVTLPIFKARALKSSSESCILVDTSSRVYGSWQDWVNHERLPPVKYCAPTDGVYKANSDGQVELLIRDSNACSLSTHAVSVADNATTLLSVGATAVGLASLFVPIAGPILYGSALTAGAAGIYGAGRSIYELVDRGRHSQSISLADREARGYWLSVVSNSFGVGAKWAQLRLLGSVSASATAGQWMDRARWIAFATAEIGCRATDGLKILHACESILRDAKKGQTDPLVIFQFTASVLFFTNNMVRFETAQHMIRTLERNALGVGNSAGSHAAQGPPATNIDENIDQSFELI